MLKFISFLVLCRVGIAYDIPKDSVCNTEVFEDPQYKIGESAYTIKNKAKGDRIYVDGKKTAFLMYKGDYFGYKTRCALLKKRLRFVGGIHEFSLNEFSTLPKYSRYVKSVEINEIIKNNLCDENLKFINQDRTRANNIMYRTDEESGNSFLDIKLSENKEIDEYNSAFSSTLKSSGDNPVLDSKFCILRVKQPNPVLEEVGIENYDLFYIQKLNFVYKANVFTYLDKIDKDVNKNFAFFMKMWDFSKSQYEKNLINPKLGDFFILDTDDNIHALLTKKTTTKNFPFPISDYGLKRIFNKFASKDTYLKFLQFGTKISNRLVHIKYENYFPIFEDMFLKIAKKFILSLEEKRPEKSFKQYKKEMNRLFISLIKRASLSQILSVTGEQKIESVIKENDDYNKRLKNREKIRQRLTGSTGILSITTFLVILFRFQ